MGALQAIEGVPSEDTVGSQPLTPSFLFEDRISHSCMCCDSTIAICHEVLQLWGHALRTFSLQSSEVTTPLLYKFILTHAFCYSNTKQINIYIEFKKKKHKVHVLFAKWHPVQRL